MSLNGTDYVQVAPAGGHGGSRAHPSLPSRPGFDVKPIAEVVPLKQGAFIGTTQGPPFDLVAPADVKKDENLSAAERLKAELAASMGDDDDDDEEEGKRADQAADVSTTAPPSEPATATASANASDDGKVDLRLADGPINGDGAPRGIKRKVGAGNDDIQEELAELDEDGDDTEAPPNPEADQPVSKKKLSVNANGTVDYEDDVRCVQWRAGASPRRL